ncbi:MAG: 50S ribosomal protein L18 [Butyricicoccus sp.]|uniref:50S ribosomal protein L18 n=1 Tax=Intestinibacillus sp. Marseille-P6563 TaxID=2364792 RepID=UPI000F05E45E|nr:50S ribosomal protein L18 [Intestinibacillus sp. Marseille-P6563]MDR3766179.1 50S ribosomal protein L18 [Butyricicoccus sp.]
MVSKKDSNKARLKRHKRVRSKVSGTAQRPRLDVFRSAKNIYAQVIDDVAGVTLVSASTTEKDFTEYGGNKDAAKKVGLMIAERCKAKGIENVVFDRGGYLYHGRVKELAEGAREGGLQF